MGIPLALSFAARSQSYVPDHERTPGAINPYVTQANLQDTACIAGWTRRVRPSSSYTNRIKSVQMQELDLVGGCGQLP